MGRAQDGAPHHAGQRHIGPILDPSGDLLYPVKPGDALPDGRELHRLLARLRRGRSTWAAARTASNIFRYPVQRQRLPARARAI